MNHNTTSTPTIFISYRRDDSSAIVGRIADRLRDILGPDAVTLDVDSLPYGTDFRNEIRTRIAQSVIVLVVIGPRWVVDVERLSGPDWCSYEIEMALSLGKRIFPVLVEGQKPLAVGTLPEVLRPIAFLNSLELQTGSLFDRQFKILAEEIGTAIDVSAKSSGAGVLNPHVAAAEALLGMENETTADPHVRHIEDFSELRTLWEIDIGAYREASIQYDSFVRWYETYEPGLKAVFFDDRVVAAFGLFPITDHEVKRLRQGEFDEDVLDIVVLNHVTREPISYWYFSGIVLTETLRRTAHRNPLKLLLGMGLNLWLESGHIAFPCELFAIGYSPEGQRMCERFGFMRICSEASEKDPYPVFWIKARSKAEMINMLRKRGLPV